LKKLLYLSLIAFLKVAVALNLGTVLRGKLLVGIGKLYED